MDSFAHQPDFPLLVLRGKAMLNMQLPLATPRHTAPHKGKLPESFKLMNTIHSTALTNRALCVSICIWGGGLANFHAVHLDGIACEGDNRSHFQRRLALERCVSFNISNMSRREKDGHTRSDNAKHYLSPRRQSAAVTIFWPRYFLSAGLM